MAQRSRRPFKLWGLLRPVKKDEGEAAEEEEDDDVDDVGDPEPLDVVSDSGQMDLRPARRKVIIKEEKSGKEYEVVGRFPFIGPWWKVNVKVKQVGSKYYVQGYPSYFLQTDVGKNQISVTSLFFKECNVPELFISVFFKWLPKGFSLNFIRLKEILEQFKETKSEEKQIPTNTQTQTSSDTNNFDIFRYVKESSTGKAVLVALDFPIIMQFLPTLLPHNVSDCIQWLGPYESDKLTKLDTILKEEPWKLGFSTIMNRELFTKLGEASWKALCECKQLLQKIPDLQKNALIVYEKLKQSCRQMGHTYEEREVLTRMVLKEMPVEHAWESLKFMKDEKIVVTEGECVFLPKFYKSELEIATAVQKLRGKSPWQLHVDVKKILSGGAHINNLQNSVVEGEINDEGPCEMEQEELNSTSDMEENDSGEQTVKEESKSEIDPDQESAIKLICSNPVTVISGKGGCGKTTVVSCLFRYLKESEEEETINACKDFEADLDASEEWNIFRGSSNLRIYRKEYLNILFTAPTGRAASLLRDKTKLPAYTLHQVIHNYYAWRKRDSEFSTGSWKFSTVNVLVVDEGSLVSVCVLSNVLELLLKYAQLEKLVVLGDIRQLPSIDPGNMLADMFESLKSRGWSVELRTNHRTESQLIVDNATRISQQKYPEFDAVLRISEEDKMWPMPSPEKKFILVALPTEDGSNYMQSAIKALLERGPGLEDPKKSQFISFRRKDCDIINEQCCMHYSKHPMRDHKNKLQFMRGDKICSTRNAYVRDLLPEFGIHCPKEDKDSKDSSQGLHNESLEEEDQPSDNQQYPLKTDDGTRLCNGEIFFINKDEGVNRQRLLTIGMTDGPEYTLMYQALLRNAKIKHAWARTIHTFQGSEENTVVYVVGTSGHQNWQHVYTAVTRGCCRVYIVAEEAKLRAAIDRKNIRRKTSLQKKLKDALAGKIDIFPQISSQSSCQSQESYFASQAGNGFINKEDPVVSDKMEVHSELGIMVELDGTAEKTSLHPDELKRQCKFPDDCSSPSKVALITEDNRSSPLGTTSFRRMTLENPVAKKLFQS
ncbi:DNA helicase B [Elgaria multicarinata webbii]|uniref:DNA helicase B n=1 Tax=Elgaria multicarinata webbii TaxID=159646 RepID=UPI002FCCD87D